MENYARFCGAVDGNAYFQHMTGDEAIVCERVDTIVSCYAAQANRDSDWIESIDGVLITRVGDAVSPRTVEEAILEGLNAAMLV